MFCFFYSCCLRNLPHRIWNADLWVSVASNRHRCIAFGMGTLQFLSAHPAALEVQADSAPGLRGRISASLVGWAFLGMSMTWRLPRRRSYTPQPAVSAISEPDEESVAQSLLMSHVRCGRSGCLQMAHHAPKSDHHAEVAGILGL